jgi:hypothetical protein
MSPATSCAINNKRGRASGLSWGPQTILTRPTIMWHPSLGRTSLIRMLGQRRYVVSVPHAFCEAETPWSRSVCDRTSEESARAICDALPTSATKMLLGNTPRSMMDLNRRESRGSPWRRKLEETILQSLKLASPEIVVLLDVHSFPRGSFQGTRSDLIIMDITPVASWTEELTDYLVRGGVAAAFVVGSDDNDVILYARAHPRVAAVLMEFCDDMPSKRRRAACSACASFVSSPERLVCGAVS